MPAPAVETVRGMGWIPDYPDFRDYTEKTGDVRLLLGRLRSRDAARVPGSVDLREYCSPIENQGRIGSCTAHAGTGIIEYYERKSFGKHLDASRLFLYKVTRNLMKAQGDTGAFLRTTMAAMVLFGVPPEEYWAYRDDAQGLEAEPPAFCYAYALNYQTLRYFRHDPPGSSAPEVLNRMKDCLRRGHPSMFGFTVYSCIEQADGSGRIPFPSAKERLLGGHAVVAVGYDDRMDIRNRFDGSETTGALLIRNSWGSSWGEAGYGWLPYEYVHRGLARDVWSILKKEWIDTGQFGG